MTYELLTDDELVQRARDGDVQAFDMLARRHDRTAMRTALGILRHREDAEDEVQNALWRAFEHIGEFEGGCRFSTWLTRIVVNQCLMRLRSERRVQFVALDDPKRMEESFALREIADNTHAPDRELIREQIEHVVRHEVQRIPPLLREALVLRHLNDLAIAEVAARLGITAAAAKSRLLRARAELEKRLQRHQGPSGPATLVA